jgi:hypothetical protein
VTINPFRQLTPPRPQYVVLTTLVDPNAPLKEGDLVAFCWARKDGTVGEVIFGRCWGPTGRDANGRFVRKGSRDEHYETEVGMYCAEDLSVQILGKVLVAHDLGERLTPPPKAG